MKTTKVFLILTALLIAGVISAFAGGSLETAQDVLDILRDASQSGSDTAGVPPAPTGVTAARNPAGSTDVRVSWNAVSGATWTAVANSPFDYQILSIVYGNNRFVAVGWNGKMAYCDW